MSTDYRVLCAVGALWSLAVAFKAINAIRTGEAYVLGMWDGGLIFSGKRLKPIAAKVKAVLGISITVCAALFGAGVGSPVTYYGLIGLLVALFAADLALGAG